MPRRPPLTPEALSSEGSRIYPLLNEGSDVAVVMVSVSYVDQCLAALLAKHMRQGATASELLDASSGALGNFSTRAKLAYALALVDKPMFKDLTVLAELRNEVAHTHFELTFRSEQLINRCKQLQYVAALTDENTGAPIFEEVQLAHPRNRFIMSSLSIAQRLLLFALAQKHAENAA